MKSIQLHYRLFCIDKNSLLYEFVCYIYTNNAEGKAPGVNVKNTHRYGFLTMKIKQE